MSARLAITVLILVLFARSAPLNAQDTQPDKMRQVVYAVADLVVPADMDMTKPQRQAAATLEVKLMQLVRRTCEPSSWAEVGGSGAIQYMPKEMKLIVCQTARCHERIRELLAELRKLQDTEISIETRNLTLSPARAKQLESMGAHGKIGKFLPADGPDAVCLSDRELLLLFALAQDDRNSSVMAAPKITMFNGQKCVLTVTDLVGVKDGDVDHDGKAFTSAWVEVGIRNVLQPVVEPEDGSVRLAVECSQTVQSETTARGRVFVTQQIRHVVRVPQDQTVALKLGGDAKGRQQYVLLTPRVLRPSEDSTAEPSGDVPAVQAKRPRHERCLRVFPIADLLAPIVADAAAGAPKNGPAKRTMVSRSAEPMTAPALVELITASVAPSTWEGKGGSGAIDYYSLGQALVVLHRGDVHEEVESLLAALRRLRDLRVSLDCRLLELPEAAVERIVLGKSRRAEVARSAPRSEGSEEQDRIGQSAPVESRPTGAASASKSLLPLSKSGLALNPREAQELRRLLAEQEPAVVEHVLGAVTFNGCLVRMDKTRPYTYTTNVNVGLVDGRVVVKPVTHTIRFGTVIEALPTVKANRAGLSLAINVQHAILGQAIAMQTVRVGPKGGETEYVLEAPSLHIIDTTTTVDLAKTGTLVLPLGAVLSDSRNEFGPPVLSKIPYVNRLFRNVGYGRETRLLYVVITPQVHTR